MDRNARRRKHYAEMPSAEKDALLQRRREAYAAKKMNLPNMACFSAAPTGAPTCKRNQKRYISRTGLGHVETGICFPGPESEAQAQQKRAEPDSSCYNAKASVSATTTTTTTTNSKNQSSSFQNNPCLDDSQLTQLFESILNKLHTDQPASNPGASFNSEQASAFADHMHISDSGGKI